MTNNDLEQALRLSEQTAWQEQQRRNRLEKERVMRLSEQTAWQEEERVIRLSEQTALEEEQRRILERRSQLSIASMEEREHFLMNRIARLESSLNREKTDYKFVILVVLITSILTQFVSRFV